MDHPPPPPPYGRPLPSADGHDMHPTPGRGHHRRPSGGYEHHHGAGSYGTVADPYARGPPHFGHDAGSYSSGAASFDQHSRGGFTSSEEYGAGTYGGGAPYHHTHAPHYAVSPASHRGSAFRPPSEAHGYSTPGSRPPSSVIASSAHRRGRSETSFFDGTAGSLDFDGRSVTSAPYLDLAEKPSLIGVRCATAEAAFNHLGKHQLYAIVNDDNALLTDVVSHALRARDGSKEDMTDGNNYVKSIKTGLADVKSAAEKGILHVDDEIAKLRVTRNALVDSVKLAGTIQKKEDLYDWVTQNKKSGCPAQIFDSSTALTMFLKSFHLSESAMDPTSIFKERLGLKSISDLLALNKQQNLNLTVALEQSGITENAHFKNNIQEYIAAGLVSSSFKDHTILKDPRYGHRTLAALNCTYIGLRDMNSGMLVVDRGEKHDPLPHASVFGTAAETAAQVEVSEIEQAHQVPEEQEYPVAGSEVAKADNEAGPSSIEETKEETPTLFDDAKKKELETIVCESINAFAVEKIGTAKGIARHNNDDWHKLFSKDGSLLQQVLADAASHAKKAVLKDERFGVTTTTALEELVDQYVYDSLKSFSDSSWGERVSAGVAHELTYEWDKVFGTTNPPTESAAMESLRCFEAEKRGTLKDWLTKDLPAISGPINTSGLNHIDACIDKHINAHRPKFIETIKLTYDDGDTPMETGGAEGGAPIPPANASSWFSWQPN